MWIMTPYGFFSIVRAHDDNPHKVYPPPPHPELMMIRARMHISARVGHRIRSRASE